MAEAKLTIDIDVDGVAKAVAGLASVNRAVRNIDSRTRGLAQTAGAAGQGIQIAVNKWKKSFDQFDKMVQTIGRVGLKALSMSLKFATIEMIAMGGAMLAIHGAFVLGNATMKAMRATLGPLAAGMTAVVAAASAASAAIREQQAAMFAYKTKSSPEFGSGLNQTRQVMRTLHTDVELATVGIENLNAAYAAVSRTSTFTAQSQKTLKGLMDFASAGQPLEEGVKKAGELIAIMQNSKKSFSEAKKAAEGMFGDGTQMKDAFKKLNITTKKGLEEAINNGKLASAAGVEGQFNAVSGTLIGRLKGYFNIIRNQLADLGQPMLEPMRQAANDIFNILRNGFVKISGNTQQFGMTTMLEGLVGMVQKLTDWSTNLINNNIKSVDGMFQRMSGWWTDFKFGWNETLDKLRPFIDGARVIEKMFGQIWEHVKNIVSSGFNQFNEWLVQNEETVIEFGGKVGDLITSIMKFQQEMKKILQDLMPFINDIVGGISAMVDQMTGFIKLLRGLTGGGTIGALASLLAVRGGFKAMAGTKGGFTVQQQLQNQPINAQNVTINTPRVVGGGGNLGTTGAAMRGGPGPGGLAQMGPVYPGGPVVPPGGGGRGGGTSGVGNFRTVPAMQGLASANRGAPYSYTPYIGQPGYSGPTPIAPRGGPAMQRAIAGANMYRQWSYSTFMAPGMSDDDRRTARFNQKNASGNPTFRAKMSQRAAAQRAARSGPNQSKGYRRLNKFQNSQGARMGTTLALGALSQMAPEEAQGALALGGMIGMVNPLAGLGVAGLGTAMKSKTATGGMVSGAAGGAAMGALVGSIVPGIGTAAGAAAGALIGAVSGGIMGSINADKEKVKAARTAASNAAQSIIDGALSGVFDALKLEERKGSKGRTALRDALPNIMKQQKAALDIINKAPEARGNYAGIMPDFMDRGATGGQLGLAFESATGKRMPKVMRQLVGSLTTGTDIAGNLLYGTISKIPGLNRLGNNNITNPLGYAEDRKKDVDRQKQEATLKELYLKQSSIGMKISEKEFDDMMKKPGESLKKMRTDMENNEKAMAPLQEKYNGRMNELNRITGKTDTEINALAKDMGVNLMDSTKDFTEVLRELGLLTVKTVDELRAAMTDVYAQGLRGFDNILEKLEAPEILNETAKGFAQLARASGGKVSEKDKTKFVKDIMEQSVAYFGGDTQKAYAQTIESLGVGGSAYSGTGPLRGMEHLGLLQSEDIKAVLDEIETGFGEKNALQLNAMLGNNDMSVDSQEFQKRFKNMDIDQQMQVKQILENGLGDSPAALKMIEAAGGDTNQAILNAIGMGDLAMKKIEQPVLDMSEASLEIAKSTKALIEQMSIYFKKTDDAVPSWYTKESFEKLIKGDDTSTPRGKTFGDTTSSRLSQTMGRHASMDSALTGKRTVTSGYRNYGLGSINSDHVTGRAYDIVGQNLGQYQSLVKATGGFAEFHGVNSARHLHVVPGSGAMGDRSVPVMSGGGVPTVQASSGGGSNSYNFYVTGNQNASAQEIAEMVMLKVKEVERSNRERR
jgi:hypothetical protein